MLITCCQGCQIVYFQTKKSQFGYILEGPGMENVGIFNDHLEYFRAIWYMLWNVFGMFGPRKIWQPSSSCSAENISEKVKKNCYQ
jgi:hypothetical protein